MRRFEVWLGRLLLALGVTLATLLPVAAAEKLLIFSASSLTDVMSEIGDEFSKKTGTKVSFSFAGTGQLARQIEAGAPADVFISADPEWMVWAKGKGLLDDSTAIDFAGNHLVIATRNEVENWADVNGLLTADRFAMGDPDSVPAGRYARQALIAQGFWEAARDNAVYGENVRVVLRRLALGEVGAAVVYATDAQAEPEVRVLFTFPSKAHDAIVYSAAALMNRPAAAQTFVEYLTSGEAKTILKRYGFTNPADKR